MHKAKRIFAIGDFKDHLTDSIRVICRQWVKGLIRLGHDVQRFTYRNIAFQYSISGSLPWLGKKKADKLLLKQIKSYYPDIILILTMKLIPERTVIAMRRAAPDAIIIGREFDPFPDENPDRIAIARHTDIVTSIYSGKWLKTYKDAGVPCCAFIPHPCDPDLHHPYEVKDKEKANIIFVGNADQPRYAHYKERYDLVLKLSQLPHAKVFGCFGNPPIYGIDYFRAISGAKIALSINIVNDVELYHSDRFINSIACGTFTLAKYVPGSELLFEDGVHLKYFDTAEEFFELADWYLKHDNERERIAKAGMEKAHRDFNCVKMAGHLMDLIEKGTIDAPWARIL